MSTGELLGGLKKSRFLHSFFPVIFFFQFCVLCLKVSKWQFYLYSVLMGTITFVCSDSYLNLLYPLYPFIPTGLSTIMY